MVSSQDVLTLIQAPFAGILPGTGTPGVVVKLTLVVLMMVQPFGLPIMATILDRRWGAVRRDRVWYWYRWILATSPLEALFVLLVFYLASPRPPTGGEVVWGLALGFAFGLGVGGGMLNWNYLPWRGTLPAGLRRQPISATLATQLRLEGASIGPSLAAALVALALTATGIVR